MPWGKWPSSTQTGPDAVACPQVKFPWQPSLHKATGSSMPRGRAYGWFLCSHTMDQEWLTHFGSLALVSTATSADESVAQALDSNQLKTHQRAMLEILLKTRDYCHWLVLTASVFAQFIPLSETGPVRMGWGSVAEHRSQMLAIHVFFFN